MLSSSGHSACCFMPGVGNISACMQLNLALVGLLNVSLALEDPFDNQGLDGIYVDEALFEAEQVCFVSAFSGWDTYCDVIISQQ